MSRRHLLILSLILLLPSMLLAADAVDTSKRAEYAPGEVLVILARPDVLTVDSAGLNADAALAPILERHGLTRAECILDKASLSERDGLYLRLISDSPDFDVVAATGELAASDRFRAVSPNYNFSVLLTPNDPMLNRQWFVTSATAGISLQQAWDVTTGSDEVVIAILDTGLDWSHPDLHANCWQNPNEVAGNGVDDDGNGYIDDIYGWDCGQNDADPRPAPYHEAGMDVGFHGTHCGGIASAVTNNAVGVAGAGFNCKLMGLKTTDGDNFSLSAIVMGFDYAMTTLPDVISMSFGGSYAEMSFMQALVDDATAAGIICVAAAGNNDTSAMMYPAALNHVISVGATNSSNQRASFSTYGTWVDVAAPGEHIWSTIQNNYDFDFLTALLYGMLYEYDGVNPYMYCDGTSMACPLVAGVCGLVRSVAPTMDCDAMNDHLRATGDNVNYDQPIGVKVNAFNAVTDITTAADGSALAPLGLALSSHPNPFNPTTTIKFSLAAAGVAELAIHDVSGRLLRVLEAGFLSAGAHDIVWDGRDEAGNSLPSGVYFARLVAGGESGSTKLLLLK